MSHAEQHIHIDTWGQPGHLTSAQEDALKDFMQKASPADLEKSKFSVESLENVSLRFLRARTFHVDQALQLLHECVKRKTDGQVDHWAKSTSEECAQCDVDALKKYYPHGNFGFDKLNRPVLFEYSGLVDGHAIYQMTTLEHCINYHWWTMEHVLDDLLQRAAQRGPSVISTCAVVDLTGLNSSHASNLVMNHVKALVAVDNVCYPETLGKMLVVNAPWLATSLWEMCKGWLDPRTQAKIEILGSGPEVNKRLLEFIDAEFLPQRYGGNAPDPDFHRDNSEYLWIGRASAAKKSVTVPPGKKLKVDFYVTDGDVSFEAYVTTAASPEAISSQVTVFNAAVPTGSKDTHAHALHETVGLADVARFAQTEHLDQLEKREVKGPESKHPVRTQLELANVDNVNKTFFLFWGNASRWTQRPLAYALHIVDA